jgi:F-type H+-transporting ATPase subunit b
MPQLDFATYLPQMVWLVIAFVGLYVLMARVALPRIAEVLEEREDRVADDLERAHASKEEAEQVLEAYERELLEARSKAHAVAQESRRRLAAEVAEKKAEVERALEAEAVKATERIGATRNQAMANLRELAQEVTRAAVARLIGRGPDDDATLVAAVDAEIEGKA